jgi:hypothetical protein
MNHALDPIQMLWVRGDLSRMELLSVRSFLAHGHPVQLYTYEPARNLPAGVQTIDAAEIVPRELAPVAATAPFGKGSMGSFSDFFRYHLLHARGGWWADMDIVCTRPWRFAEAALTASTDEPEYGRVANTCVMRFPAGHPVMAACREAFRHMDVRKIGIDQTGPLLLHAKLDALGQRHLALPPEVFCPVPWNASWQLLRPFWRRFTFSELNQRLRYRHLSPRFGRATVAVHLWHETWRAAGWDKAARHPRSCLYERLQRRWNP